MGAALVCTIFAITTFCVLSSSQQTPYIFSCFLVLHPDNYNWLLHFSAAIIQLQVIAVIIHTSAAKTKIHVSAAIINLHVSAAIMEPLVRAEIVQLQVSAAMMLLIKVCAPLIKPQVSAASLKLEEIVETQKMCGPKTYMNLGR